MNLSDIMARVAAFYGEAEIPLEEGEVYRVKSGESVVVLREYEPGRSVVGWTAAGPVPRDATPKFFQKLLMSSMDLNDPELHRAAYSLDDGQVFLHRTDSIDVADPIGAVGALISDLAGAAEATRRFLTYYVPEYDDAEVGGEQAAPGAPTPGGEPMQRIEV